MSVKEGFKKFGKSIKDSVNNLGEKINKAEADYKMKQLTTEAFEKKATKLEVVGKKNFIGEQVYRYAYIEKKELYFRSEDNLDDILEGTMFKDGDTLYEIKELIKDHQEYVEVEVTIEKEDPEDSEKKITETETVQVPCTRAIAKIR